MCRRCVRLCLLRRQVRPGTHPGDATLNSGNGNNEAGSNASSDVNLASPDRTTHILTGDSTGGGHQWPGGPGNSVFPENWSGSKIVETVSDIATDPSIPESVQANGRIVKNGTRDGVDIRVVIEPASKGGGIVTAFPTNVPRNPE
ncbi:EndoU domain-containing protein [Paraburkholderia bannensis]|uniref:EndoU domain-containing protein n=1 Tax=Paraburkholderia bannensis TaxID=765414 RepID=UPI0038CDC52C